MSPITHALLPVFVGRKRLAPGDGRKVPVAAVVLVAVCGALPDLLSPHLSLEARFASGSHTVFAWGAFSAVALVVSVWWPLLRRFRGLCIFGYGPHLVCDLISGGVAPFYPASGSVFE